jgi:hypothetical protein
VLLDHRRDQLFQGFHGDLFPVFFPGPDKHSSNLCAITAEHRRHSFYRSLC